MPSFFSRLLSRPTQGRHRSAARRGSRRRQPTPALERLEERWVPAGFTLSLQEFNGASLVASKLITDQGTGDLDGNSGSIIFSSSVSGAVGDFSANLSFATSNSAGGGLPAQITSNDTSITSAGFTGSRTLILTVLDDGFTAPGLGPATLGSQLSTTQLPANTNVTFQSFLDATAGSVLSLNTVAGTTGSDP